ncbi:MAG: GNAT family N-acetyltransferase [Bacteroidota bacterium]
MITTQRLWLVPCTLAHFEALGSGEAALAAMLQVEFDKDWLGFPDAASAMAPAHEFLKKNPTALGWWTYLFIHRQDNMLIGLGGFKGAANEVGMVEIGYAIATSYQKRGLATEAAHGMIEYAFSHPHVTRVDAHTLAEKNASTRVLEKSRLKYIAAINDPNDGNIWGWSITRVEYVNARH